MICLGVILIVNLFIQPFSCLCDRLNYGVQIVLDARHIQRVPVIAMLFDLLRKTGCCGTNLKRNFNDCIHDLPCLPRPAVPCPASPGQAPPCLPCLAWPGLATPGHALPAMPRPALPRLAKPRLAKPRLACLATPAVPCLASPGPALPGPAMPALPCQAGPGHALPSPACRAKPSLAEPSPRFLQQRRRGTCPIAHHAEADVRRRRC